MIERTILARNKIVHFGANYLNEQTAVPRAMAQSHDALHHQRFRIQNAHPTTIRGNAEQALFQWLAYIPGLVTQVPLGGLDILSGPFTGCWMTMHKMGGRDYVGHIGTVADAADAQTVAVKTAWRNFFLAQPPATAASFIGFRPHLALSSPVFTLALQQGPPFKLLGLVTTDRRCFSVLMVNDEGMPNDTYRVAVITQQQPQGLPAVLP